MAKKIGITFLIILILTIIAGYIGIQKFHKAFFKETPSHLSYTSGSEPISFEWVNDSIGDFFETKVAISIPVQIEGLHNKFYLQFDTGAPNSLLYQYPIEEIMKTNEEVFVTPLEEDRYVDNLKFSLGGNNVEASMIEILENYGNSFDLNDTISAINLGTIGADFMINKITVIDFKNQFIQFYNERPDWMNPLPEFSSFDFTGRRFMLPCKIDGAELQLFYDSGSSTFGLITTKSRYEKFTDPDQEEIRYNANRFGDPVPICHRGSTMKMKMGKTNLDLKRVSYVDMYAKYQSIMTPFTHIGGWLGNRPFSEHMLILDTQKEEFIVVKSTAQE